MSTRLPNTPTRTRRHGRAVRRGIAVVAVLATSAFGLVAFAPSAMAAPQVYTVNSSADVGDGTCDASCTLRDALLESNASVGDHDVIEFAIGSGPVTILPQTDLPMITDQVTIDGSSQPGFSGTPLIYIDGIADGGGPNNIGLWITASGTAVQDIAISRFVSRQILVQNAGPSVIVGNYIGVGASGNVPSLGGGNFAQVQVSQSDETMVNNNVIGGSNTAGVLVDNNQTGVSVSGNNIGIGADGTTNVGNSSQGVLVLGTNIRATNIRFNQIANNGQLGIDLGGDGKDINDALDADTGSNNKQNFPVITNITQGVNTQVSATLDSLPSEAFHLDFFASQSCDSSGNGEGELFLGNGDVFTNGSGHGAININFSNPPGAYAYYTTTATADLSGVGNETSEFSACHMIDPLTAPSIPTGVSAGAGDGQADISWNTPSSNGGSTITQYTVTSNPSSPNSPMVVSAPFTTATMTGLTNGANYTFTVSATNAIGTSPNSAPSNQVQPQNGAAAPESQSTEFGGGGGTLSNGNDATTADPTNTTVQSPNAGIVTIGESTLTGTPPVDVTYFGQQIDIDAPDATVNDPMKFTFVFDCTTISTCAAPLAPRAAPTEAAALAPTTASVNVNNGSYSPPTASVRQGGAVTWQFGGTRQHSVTDTVGLGAAGGRLFNSGNRNPGATYSYTFPAAGQYAYRSYASGDRASMKGVVSVPVDVSTDTAALSDPVTVTWATSRPSGFRFDAQYRFKTPTGAYGAWRSFRSNSLMTSTSFTGADLRGQGTYQFRSHLENMNTGRKSGWSDGAATVTVSTTTTGGSGEHIDDIAMFHDDGVGGNVQVPDCTGVDGVVQPGPACTWSETINGDGDLVVVVYTTHNHRWRGGKIATH
ncbi:MAG TPA: fibronectin type III domain-containing protein [Nocardioidaceae bacterium]|nr:fibronectin type III domain-containing protein [Nocardioidaceae bacterium]